MVEIATFMLSQQNRSLSNNDGDTEDDAQLKIN